MAHYRSTDYEYFYRRRTIGQLLLLDCDAIDYIILTSPFGSDENGESRGPKRSRKVDPTPDIAMQYAREITRGWGKNAAKMTHAGKVSLDQLPPKVRILLADLERAERGERGYNVR